MKQVSFTAKELFGMAYLAKKPIMYGIPNDLGNDRGPGLQAVFDGLVSQDVADMDMDGRITLRQVYQDTVRVYCDCRKCLTVHVRTEDGAEHSYIFWLLDDACTMAEAVDERYVFSRTDADMVRAIVTGFLRETNPQEHTAVTVIPQMELAKAKRASMKGDWAGALQIVRRSGAAPDVSHAIAGALRGEGYYLGVSCMDMETGEYEKQELSYIYGGGVLLSLGETTANLRTCAAFAPVSCADMHEAVKALVDRFVGKEAQQ